MVDKPHPAHSRPILYSYFRSSCAFRVRIAINIKQIDCELKPINIHPDVHGQFDPSYLQINPQARVPFFVDGDIQIAQSSAILEYLEETYPEPPLLPHSATEKAQVRQITNTIACDIQPLNNSSVLHELRKYNLQQVDIDNWYKHWISRGFLLLESTVKHYHQRGPFCMGENFTMADIFLVPQVWNAHRFNVPMHDYPTLQMIYEHCMQMTAVLAASPEKQQDALY